MAGEQRRAGRLRWAEARTSLAAFLLGGSVVAAVPLLLRAGFQGRTALALHVAGANATLLLAWGRAPGGMYQIAIRACFLGFAFGCGLLLSFRQSSWKHFGWYMCSLSLFHYSEYLITAVNNPRSLSLDSFLLNHSFEYNMAALSSWIEFTVEKFIFPEMKQVAWLSCAGLLMVVLGDCLRKAAMLTAGSNFNHIVQNEKSESHRLVTRGVYGWCRHPSYVGWFSWSIGTQVLLCNPICLVGYTVVSWRFFRDRVEEEERTLIHFFGEEYLAYKEKEEILKRSKNLKKREREPGTNNFGTKNCCEENVFQLKTKSAGTCSRNIYIYVHILHPQKNCLGRNGVILKTEQTPT